MKKLMKMVKNGWKYEKLSKSVKNDKCKKRAMWKTMNVKKDQCKKRWTTVKNNNIADDKKWCEWS